MKRFFLLAVFAALGALFNAHAAPLHDAAKIGDIQQIKKLLDAGADINAADDRGSSALHWAVLMGHLSVTDFLLKQKADPMFANRAGRTPLHVAAAMGRPQTAALLIANGAQVDYSDNQGRTSLHLAVIAGRIATMDVLLKKGAIFSGESGYDEQDALYHAIQAGRREIISKLRAKGAMLSPFHLSAAACTGDLGLIRLLMKNGAELDSSVLVAATACSDKKTLSYLLRKTKLNLADKEIEDSLAAQLAAVMTPSVYSPEYEKPKVELVRMLFGRDARIKRHAHELLIPAARSHNLAFIKFLISLGAKINQPDETGNTPLHWAAQEGDIEIVKLLLKHGAKVDATSAWGNTPLLRAVPGNQVKVAAVLLEKGANVNAANELGNTALHLAAARDLTKMSTLLLNKGARKEARNKDGNTPFHQAVRFPPKFGVAHYLLDAGVNVNAKNAKGFNPLHYIALRNIEAVPDYSQQQEVMWWQRPLEETVADQDIADLIQMMATRRADFLAKNAEGKTPVDLARTNTQKANLARLMEAKANAAKP